MMPIGYFDETPRETPRKPLSEIIYLNRFGGIVSTNNRQ